MSKLTTDLLNASPIPNYVHPFTKLSANDSYEQIKERILGLKAIGIYSMDLEWQKGGGGMSLSPFNCPEYWERMAWVSEICRENGMTYMMQDAAPFPTGQADGWFEKPENLDLNKLYLTERHLDVKGPNPDGAFLIDQMVGAIRTGDFSKFSQGVLPLPGNKVIAVVAIRRENGVYQAESAVDLTDQVTDGLLSWDVPEGIWRIFTIYETHNGGGRAYYMNLLDEKSVALNIQAVHQPHYEHLKDEIGKTWLGFFFDETEVGNLDGYCFTSLPGKPQNTLDETMPLPWSGKMEGLCKDAWGEGYRKLLPLLWFEDGAEFHSVRYRYMDIVSKLIRDNYNGQMHKWCKERGIQYIGHNLEDENSHARLACGPVHYFRMQAHQDVAGIDVVGSQVMPGKDFTQAWYGYQEGDGQFYHYGLAKLASYAGHIAPNKHGRSFCEVFALYGSLAGTRLRKFVYDHLFVNGVSELIPADPRIPGADPKYCLRENNYTGRMCHLLQHTRPVIQTAVLYHAESEWYGGNYELFQLPASELAKHQISYDVVPADIFADTDFYQTDCSEGLTVNGNRYQALILPGADAIPAAVAAFIENAAATGFPVFFTDFAPKAIAETGDAYTPSYGKCVPLAELAETVSSQIKRDITLTGAAPDLRYSHFTDDGGDYYLLQNQGKSTTITLAVPCTAPAYKLDLDRLTCEALNIERSEKGSTLTLELAEFETVLLYFTESAPEAAPAVTYETATVSGPWKVTLDDEAKTTLTLDTLVNINGAKYFPRYTGLITYEATVNWEKAPSLLDLGAVYEIASLYLNGEPCGEAQFAPYRIPVEGIAKAGKNTLKIVVKTNTARAVDSANRFGMGGLGAETYNSMDPGGLLGPVKALIK